MKCCCRAHTGRSTLRRLTSSMSQSTPAASYTLSMAGQTLLGSTTLEVRPNLSLTQFGLSRRKKKQLRIGSHLKRQCLAGPRVMHAATMLLEAKRWLETELPYWNRTGGRDHIWLISHDEGSCWAPSEIRPSIILSHWGRKVLILCLLHVCARVYQPLLVLASVRCRYLGKKQLSEACVLCATGAGPRVLFGLPF